MRYTVPARQGRAVGMSKNQDMTPVNGIGVKPAELEFVLSAL